MESTRTKHLLPGIKARSIAYNLFAIIAAMVLAVAVFIHFYFPTQEPEVKSISIEINELTKTIDKDNSALIDLVISYNNDLIPVNVFKNKSEFLLENIFNLEEKLIILNQLKSNTIEKGRISGYSTRNKFFWSLGIAICIFILSFTLFLASHHLKNKSDDPKLEALGHSLLFVAFTGLTVSGYFFCWIFVDIPGLNDLPSWAYKTFLVTCGATGAIGAYFFTRFLVTADNQFKVIIRKLMDVIAIDIQKKGHVVDSSKYTKDIILPTVNYLDEKTR